MSQNDSLNNKDAALGKSPSSRFAYAACSTPPGVAGIAVIRISGEDAFDVVEDVFVPVSPSYKSVREMKGYSCAYGKFIDSKEHKNIIDQVILTKFIAPESYTGEDTVEISCHGGTGVKSMILNVLYSQGARPAEPGEFTKNAFLNGKIDLSQAEAVMDIISAHTFRSETEAAKQLEGKLSTKIKQISNKIYEQMSKVEMIIEFPEHEDSEQGVKGISEELLIINKELDTLIASFRQGRILREGFTVAISGKPNAGKSSMLNTISGYERSIVTDIPGTTRDTIEEIVDVRGIPVKLIDTAGLRSSSDEVEKIGIERARHAMEHSDLVFWISSDERVDTDKLSESDEDFKYLLSLENKKKIVLIIGKSDIIPWEINKQILIKAFPESEIIPFSSVTGEGLNDVFDLILKKYEEFGSPSGEEVIITNHRHYNSLEAASRSLKMAMESINNNMPEDILAAALRSVADRISEITGDTVSEEVINEIFSRFCVGK